jgi:predicted DsbA family dithiol-disulfide isomerase
MLFTGRLFFNFDSYDVWRIYTTMVKASQEREVAVEIDWRPFLVEDLDSEAELPSHSRGLAACEAVRGSHPEQYGRFVGAMLTMAYQEKDDPGADKTLAVAAQVAGIDRDAVAGRVIKPGLSLLEKATAAARERGVSDVPTIERQGPPVYIKTTGAANYGNAVERLDLINRMLDEDGIWTLAKP